MPGRLYALPRGDEMMLLSRYKGFGQPSAPILLHSVRNVTTVGFSHIAENVDHVEPSKFTLVPWGDPQVLQTKNCVWLKWNSAVNVELWGQSSMGPNDNIIVKWIRP